MKKIRVYELARELDTSSKDLINKLIELDINVNSHMSTLEKEEAELVKSILTDSVEEKKEKKDSITNEKDDKNIDKQNSKKEKL